MAYFRAEHQHRKYLRMERRRKTKFSPPTKELLQCDSSERRIIIFLQELLKGFLHFIKYSHICIHVKLVLSSSEFETIDYLMLAVKLTVGYKGSLEGEGLEFDQTILCTYVNFLIKRKIFPMEFLKNKTL